MTGWQNTQLVLQNFHLAGSPGVEQIFGDSGGGFSGINFGPNSYFDGSFTAMMGSGYAAELVFQANTTITGTVTASETGATPHPLPPPLLPAMVFLWQLTGFL